VAKLGARMMLVAGIAMLGLSQVLLAGAQDLAPIYAGGLLIGLGLGCASTTAVSYVVNKWFTRNRGTVLGAILALSGIGTAVSTALLRPVIQSERSVFGFTGWRTAYWISAVATFALIFLVLLLYRSAPERTAEERLPEKKRGRDWSGVEWKQVLKTPSFYLICFCVILGSGAAMAVYNSVAAHLEDVGLDSAVITRVMSVSSILLFVAKLLSGVIYDRFGLLTATLSSDLAAIVAFLLLAAAGTSDTCAVLGELLLPFCLPIATVLLPLLASDLYGEKSVTQVTGVFLSVNYVGYAVGGVVINRAFDLARSYIPILFVFAGLMVLVTVLIAVLIRRGEAARDALEASAE
jgi:predicted MFS family arabinose efflux permease